MSHTHMTTAAHQVLLCRELYHLICENCDIQTLMALSRTSRNLQDGALDLLWSEILDFGPLIRCMPSDLWEERPLISCMERREMREYHYTLVIFTLILLSRCSINGVVLPQGNTDHGLA